MRHADDRPDADAGHPDRRQQRGRQQPQPGQPPASSRYGVASHSTPENASEPIVSSARRRRPGRAGARRRSRRSRRARREPTSCCAARGSAGRRPALVEALQRAREGQRGHEQQQDPQRRDARLHACRWRRTPAARCRPGRARRSKRSIIVSAKHRFAGQAQRRVDDEQGDQRRVAVGGDRHRTVEALDVDEPREPVAPEPDDRRRSDRAPRSRLSGPAVTPGPAPGRGRARRPSGRGAAHRPRAATILITAANGTARIAPTTPSNELAISTETIVVNGDSSTASPVDDRVDDVVLDLLVDRAG